MHAEIIVVNDSNYSTDDNFTFNKDFSSCIQFLIIVKDNSVTSMSDCVIWVPNFLIQLLPHNKNRMNLGENLTDKVNFTLQIFATSLKFWLDLKPWYAIIKQNYILPFKGRKIKSILEEKEHSFQSTHKQYKIMNMQSIVLWWIQSM